MGSGSIAIISGPVGAGKTAVAKALVDISRAPVAAIEGDEFWKFIAKGDGPPRGALQTIMSSMTAAAVPFAVAGYEVIVDFSIPPWNLERCQKIVSRREIPLHFVVLRPSQSVCAARAAQRPDGAIQDHAQYEELYRDFQEAERHTISDDEIDPETLACRVKEGLDAGQFLAARN